LAGGMISSPEAAEAVVTDAFTEDFGFEKPEDAVGQTLEFLAPPANSAEKNKNPPEPVEEAPANFFGIPLDEEDSSEASQVDLVARKFRIVGVLDLHLKEGPGQGGMVGLLPGAEIYVPVSSARQWSLEHRGPMSQVALALARQSGSLNEAQAEGYDAAVIRVNDPV